MKQPLNLAVTVSCVARWAGATVVLAGTLLALLGAVLALMVISSGLLLAFFFAVVIALSLWVASKFLGTKSSRPTGRALR